ncbi:MAG: RluA family pseudouridine synthase [Lachnospiraceae bacterium]|nr:RluA family pseudouridine synthase [Lachnospiraceae bacterium]
MKKVEIGNKEENQRLDKFLFKYFNDAPKSFVYKMLRKKRIKLNSQKAEGSEILNSGDFIEMYLADETMDKFMSAKEVLPIVKRFNVIYEDENLLVVSKPAGLLCHSDLKEDKDTLINQILFYLSSKGEYVPKAESSFTPALANRLDRNTSGIVFCGKNLAALQDINRVIAEKKVEKLYYALVLGKVLKEGELKNFYSKDEKANKAFISKDDSTTEVCLRYRPLKAIKEYSLLEIKLITGKSHQIRLQLKEAGHPIAGDRKYGDLSTNIYFKENFGLAHQFLHAGEIKWESKEGFLSYLYGKEFDSPLPLKLSKIEKSVFDK